MDIGKKEFIEFMLGAGVLKFGEFITKSGRQTPYFVNTGLYKTGGQISRLGTFYANLIQEKAGDSYDAMFGPAYKGIPLVVAAADALYREHNVDKPYCFNRKEVKDHGEGGSMVGYTPQDGDRFVIVEDVITAGTAIRESMPALRAYGDIKVPHMCISVDRCEMGTDESGNIVKSTAVMHIREEYGIEVHSIVNVMDIHDFLKAGGEDKDVLERMEIYMDKYCML